MEKNKTPEDVVNLLVEALTPKKEKKTAKKDRVLSVNGTICPELVSLKEAKKIAKQYSTQDVEVKIYILEGTLKVTLPVEVV